MTAPTTYGSRIVSSQASATVAMSQGTLFLLMLLLIRSRAPLPLAHGGVVLDLCVEPITDIPETVVDGVEPVKQLAELSGHALNCGVGKNLRGAGLNAKPPVASPALSISCRARRRALVW